MEITLDELKDEEDVVIESQGISIVYSKDIEVYLRDSVVDYSNSWYERGFVIKGAGVSSC